MMEMDSELLQLVRPTGEAQHILSREINLGAHHLLLKSDQSIELMHTAQGRSESEYVLCLDAMEAYRLMIALRESFHIKTGE